MTAACRIMSIPCHFGLGTSRWSLLDDHLMGGDDLMEGEVILDGGRLSFDGG